MNLATNRVFTISALSLAMWACGGHTPANDNQSKPSDQASPQSQQTKENHQAPPLEELQVLTDSAQPAIALAPKMTTQHSMPIAPDTMTYAESNRENYASIEEQSVKRVIDEPVSTFSTDVDTASYTNARRFLTNGQLPPSDAIRIEEFINYFDYDWPRPNSLSEPLAIDTEWMPTPWNANTKLMRVSLQSYQSNFDDLAPLNLVFLLDVSGSMSDPDKLPLMQRSFNLLVEQLRAQDRVSIVVYAGDSGVVLEPTAGDQKAAINAAINQLNAGGSTHGSAGIELAYQLAAQHAKANSINRVIIGTDGDFNVGTTGIDALKDLIEQKRDNGIFLSVLGFGTGNYNDHLMETLSNHGNGNAFYIDSFNEARRIFADQLTATLQTVAKDVKLQVEFNPAYVSEYRLIGYDNRVLAREDFNNDRVDAGDMGSGHSVTALYEIVPTAGSFRFNDPLRYQSQDKAPSQGQTNTAKNGEWAHVKVRYKEPNASQSQLLSLAVNASDQAPSQDMQLAAHVAGFAQSLRQSKYINDYNLDDALKGTAQAAQGHEDKWGYRQELIQLIRNAKASQ
ncbi:vWA domain-containing protein [Motilimonas eburnea]|uniref:vWA domain-containing protein n=1 Tax=Motilimonas eburnea TaxID=1737488 RepID=UPI001E306C29|nr:VWA domain-containing protein [Motilimonas eburnea]MCE2573875.1 VWA domain-containing protein [Motilimonas eburnea]